MNCAVKPHYKLVKLNSNFVLKFLFNHLAKKSAAEWVSLIGGSMRKIATGRVGNPSMQGQCETGRKMR
jgi:hypothetical protein